MLLRDFCAVSNIIDAPTNLLNKSMTELASIYNKNYLSKRPFLIVNNSFKPPAEAYTATKGWADQTGWDRHEQIVIVDRVTDKHRQMASVIIDILEIKVIKNSFDHTHTEVIKYFVTKYKSQIKESLKLWANKESLKLAKIDSFNEERRVTEQAEIAALAQDVASVGDGESPAGEETA